MADHLMLSTAQANHILNERKRADAEVLLRCSKPVDTSSQPLIVKGKVWARPSTFAIDANTFK